MPVISLRAPRRTAAIVAVSAALLFTAACGSDDAGTDSATGGAGQNGGADPFAAYISCLDENGVTITMPSGGPGGARPSGAPDGAARPSGQPRPSGSAGQRGGGFPGGGGFGKPDGVDDATWTKAQEACAAVRPSMGAGRGDGGGPGQNGGAPAGGGNAGAAYENCLKENGVTDTADLDTTNATVKKATETCAVLKPTGS
ncbi:hypothetical protein [Actinoplanes utahensis]|uniref:PT repeat-containing protein n=1 Tax=Actinoplanes utahensis TaxID=1869 RepID=A0A0A6UG35_ACTUT|nr:hypothetical protein [Actinoplanes utahensis]KHD73259.1 hypothetical protein MB27_35495 [Actinoplanes utahensis]GIF27464.1 hypothetical protein Aut01nite_04500 [Actinoplanes utahensis]